MAAVNMPDGLSVPPARRTSTSRPNKKPAPRPRSQAPRTRNPSPPPPMAPPPMPGQSGPISPITGPSARTRAPNIQRYLAGDDVYQQAVRGSNRTLRDFISELSRRRGEAGTTFNQTKESMENDRTLNLQKMRDEFASRGTLHSSLFADEQGRFQDEFSRQLRSLEQQQTALLSDLSSQGTNFKREQKLALELAKQEALRRRAERFNLGL